MSHQEQSQQVPGHGRNPWVAGVLSILFPGLGQAYNGQFKKAGLFLSIPIVGVLIVRFTRSLNSFEGLLLSLGLLLLLRLVILIDAVKVAKRLESFLPPPAYQRIFWTIVGLAAGWAVLLDQTKLMGYRAFTIPTPSQYPTMQREDAVMVDMRAYHNTQIRRGDIVVFSIPEFPFMSFRIVGMPGDTIALVKDVVVLNGDTSKIEMQKDTFLNDDFPVVVYLETFGDGHKHQITKFVSDRFVNPMQDLENTIIPVDHYFLLGDNRDNAMDSRHIGMIHRKDIKGKLLYTYWGKTNDRIGIDLTK